MGDQTRLAILHVFRSPVGGLFRHVRDLAEGQIARGHDVGMIVSSLTGGERAEEALAALAPRLSLGLTRIPMRRAPHPSDIAGAWHVRQRARATGAHVIHGHGAKGGAFARLAPLGSSAVRAYTPHGGSLHFGRGTIAGTIYLTLERILMLRETLYLFESRYSEAMFRKELGTPRGIVKSVHNGVGKIDFEGVTPNADASDLVFLGELRDLKGVDVLLKALARLKSEGRKLTLTVAGEGPAGDELRALSASLGLNDSVSFVGAMPARVAFARGRIMVAPSRQESLPYVVLEAAAAGKPLITTRVGGIPEIFGPLSDRLVPAGDDRALADAIVRTIDDARETEQAKEALRARVAAEFSTDTMVDRIIAGYREALAGRQG